MRREAPSRLTCLIALFSSAATLNAGLPGDPGSAPILKTATKHPMQYYVSLPNGWQRGRRWPVVVTLDGPGKNWLADADTFASARGRLPFIIVTPLILSNEGRVPDEEPAKYPYADTVWKTARREGPEQFDQEGLEAVLEDVRRDYGGEEKYFLTGWSTGAHLLWVMVFLHPETLVAAAPACGYFNGKGITGYSDAPERVRLPVRGFQGELDRDRFGPQGSRQKVALRVPMTLVPREYGTQGSFEYAGMLAREHGYRRFSEQTLRRRGNEPFAREVLTWFNSVRR